MQRTRSEHDRLLSEFTSLLAGIETTLASTGMHIQRLHDDELFLLIQGAMNPSDADFNSVPTKRSTSGRAREYPKPADERQHRGGVG